MRQRSRGVPGGSGGRVFAFRQRPAPQTPTEAVARKAFFDGARSLTPYLAVESDELIFFVSTGDKLGRVLFAKGRRKDMAVLGHVVVLLREHGIDTQGSTFVDVGANIGTTTVAAVRRHGFARAIAIEPEPANIRMLGLNLVANGIESVVTALPMAVSDRVGEAQLVMSGLSSGLHALAASGEAETSGSTVPVTTLDELVRRGTIVPADVGVLWLDAAGGEAAVLAGASELLALGSPIVAAVRPALPGWPEASARLVELLDGYTHFGTPRTFGRELTDDLSSLLASLTRPADILAFRA